MDPITISAIIAGGVSLVSSVAGMLAKQGEDAKAEALLAEARKAYGDIDLPDLASPEAKNYYIEKSDEAEVADPAAFADAERRYDEMLVRGGETVEDTAARERGLRAIQGRLSGQQRAMRDEFAARGQGGGQMELSARLGEQEQAAQAGSQLALDTQAQQQRRALEALRERTGLAQGKFDRDSQRARARDVLRSENLRLGRQFVGDQNLTAQERWNNQLQLTERRLGRSDQEASMRRQQGQDAANTWGKIGEGGVKIATGLGDYYQRKQDKAKKV